MESGERATGDVLWDCLRETARLGASDLHLTAGSPPVVRVGGSLAPTDFPELSREDTRALVMDILTDEQRKVLEETLELDFGYELPGVGRFRVNVYFQRGCVGAAFRPVPEEVPRLEDLGLPRAIEEMCGKPHGFVLVTGPTGSGKSTTLAAMVGRMNETRREHIMSVEDPIEFIHTHKRCIVNQREVGADTKGFASALKHVLRQDPDVILVGEMRDLETISLAVTAAETGHLVLSTLHTQDAPQTIDRVIDVFPPHQQSQVRAQLANTIQGIVTQTLLPKVGGGRVAACEVLVPTPGVRNLIREGKTHQMRSAMQAGGKFGMRTMDAALASLVKRGLVASEDARKHASDLEEMGRLSGGEAEVG
ncbi:MAG: type IV pilus twitching motility protein PilT [Rubrobacter sp.]|nr:type IV pilus twitching motility protein PilT [Rubrobacter sp.]